MLSHQDVFSLKLPLQMLPSTPGHSELHKKACADVCLIITSSKLDLLCIIAAGWRVFTMGIPTPKYVRRNIPPFT